MNDRLYRSRDERMISGVAGGLAERFDVDPSLVRIVWVVLMLVTGGLFLLIYIVMALVVPEAPGGADRWAGWSDPNATPAPGAMPGWNAPGPESGTAAFAAGATSPTSGTTESPTPTPAAGAAPTGPSGTAAAAAGVGSLAAGPTAPSTGPTPTPAGPPPWSVPPPSRRRRARSGGGAIVGGIVLVLLGVYFLLRQFVPDLDLGAYWPVILIILGVALVIGSVRRGSPGD